MHWSVFHRHFLSWRGRRGVLILDHPLLYNLYNQYNLLHCNSLGRGKEVPWYILLRSFCCWGPSTNRRIQFVCLFVKPGAMLGFNFILASQRSTSFLNLPKSGTSSSRTGCRSCTGRQLYRSQQVFRAEQFSSHFGGFTLCIMGVKPRRRCASICIPWCGCAA